MTTLKSTHADLFGIQTRMMNDNAFKALCEANGLPWDPAAGYYPRWYNGPAPEDTRVLFFMAEPGAVHPGEEDALAINHEDFVHSWAFTKPACNQRRAHESWRSTADEIARRIRKLDAVEAESASRSPRSLRRPHTAESGACQLGRLAHPVDADQGGLVTALRPVMRCRIFAGILHRRDAGIGLRVARPRDCSLD